MKERAASASVPLSKPACARDEAERIWVVVDCGLGGFEMPKHEREIYHSENGDRWFLCRDEDDRTFVLHKANASSGGKVTSIELGDFLGKGKAGPEHQALARLVGGLAEDQGRGDGREHAGDNGQG